jgi:hypothetical protein
MAKVWNPLLGQWMEEDGNPAQTSQAPGSNIGPGATTYGPQALPEAPKPVTPQYANRTEEINAQNPNADPDKPYVQGGTTGGYLAGVGETIGEGRSITPAQAAAQKQAALDAGIPEAFITEFLARNNGDTNRIQEAFNSDNGGDNSPMASWSAAASSMGSGRLNDLYGILRSRIGQSLQVSPTDPTVRTQTNPFRAAVERSRRDQLADLAERGGTADNLNAETRASFENAGQQVGAFEGEIVGRELAARREEIAQALQLYAGMLTAEEDRALRLQLAELDRALSMRGQDLQNNQFFSQLGLTAEQQAAYYDLVRRGLIG